MSFINNTQQVNNSVGWLKDVCFHRTLFFFFWVLKLHYCNLQIPKKWAPGSAIIARRVISAEDYECPWLWGHWELVLPIAAAGLTTQGLNSFYVPVGPLHWRSAKLREKENATRLCPWKPTWLRAWSDLTSQRWSWWPCLQLQYLSYAFS